MPDPASPRTVTGQFLPGQSGNPAGRPQGARNKASRLREMLDDGAASDPEPCRTAGPACTGPALLDLAPGFAPGVSATPPAPPRQAARSRPGSGR